MSKILGALYTLPLETKTHPFNSESPFRAAGVLDQYREVLYLILVDGVIQEVRDDRFGVVQCLE